MTKIKILAEAIGFENMPEEVIINLLEHMEIKTEEEAKEGVAKHMLLALPKDRKLQKIESILDTVLLPHIGTTKNTEKLRQDFYPEWSRNYFNIKIKK